MRQKEAEPHDLTTQGLPQLPARRKLATRTRLGRGGMHSYPRGLSEENGDKPGVGGIGKHLEDDLKTMQQ